MTWNLSGSTLSTMNTLYTPRILTGILYNPRTIRQQMTQIMFQKVNIPAIFIVNRAVLALLFIALTTGIVLHSRYSVSHAVPAYQFHSFPLWYSISQVVIWMIILNHHNNRKKIVRDIKEKLCYVVLDYEPEMASSALLSYSTEMYALSDSQFITIDNEQFRGCTPYIFP